MNSCATEPGPVLILGYGNPLRGDDVAGPRVATAVAALGIGVRAMAVHQLTPELAQVLAQSRAAIFVDASMTLRGRKVAVEKLEPAGQGTLSAHTGDPRSLLALTQALFGQRPPAWLVKIPGRCFEIGAPLSPITEQAVTEAVKRVEQLVREVRGEEEA
jgi:hydrogenase maturation protease